MLNRAEFFKALADETRLRIVHLLLDADAEVCVCELVDALGLPQYQVSRHLAVLKRAQLVASRRDRTWAYYRLAPEASFRSDLRRLLSHWSTVPRWQEDAAMLRKRLSLRAGGSCVVGRMNRTKAVLTGDSHER